MPKYLKLGKGTSGASLSSSSPTDCPRLYPAEFWFSPMLEAPQLLSAHVLVLTRLTGNIFLCSKQLFVTSARSQKAKCHLDKKFTIPNKQQTHNQKRCVCILNCRSSALQAAQPRSVCGHILRVQFPFIPCQTGANTGDNTLSSEYFSKYGGIWKDTVLILMHCNPYCLSQWNSWQLV